VLDPTDVARARRGCLLVQEGAALDQDLCRVGSRGDTGGKDGRGDHDEAKSAAYVRHAATIQMRVRRRGSRPAKDLAHNQSSASTARQVASVHCDRFWWTGRHDGGERPNQPPSGLVEPAGVAGLEPATYGFGDRPTLA